MRTDVTFEITSGESTNDTKTVDEKEIGKDDDNASIPVVPIFKGTPDRGGSKKGIDSSYNEILSVVPLENPSDPPRIPFYQPPQSQHNGYRNHHGGNGDGGGEIVDNNDGWKVYPQYAIWTTERNSNEGHHRRINQPPAVFHHRNEGGYFQSISLFTNLNLSFFLSN